jgi:hypothetical protein
LSATNRASRSSRPCLLTDRDHASARVVWSRHPGTIHYVHSHQASSPVLSLPVDALILLRAVCMVAANALRPR